MGKVTTTFLLRDNFSSRMRKMSGTTSAFEKQVRSMARTLDIENRKRRAIRIENSPALKAIEDVKKRLQPLKDMRIRLSAKLYNFKRDMNPVLRDIGSLVKKPLIVTLKLKDMAMAGLRRLAGVVKTLAKGVTIAVGAAAAGGAYVLNKGMDLERYQMSIGHFVGVNNPQMNAKGVQTASDQYMAWLTQNAKETPFSTSDVIAAGSRAIGVTGGRIDAAQGYVRMAENMAALTPGKTIMDAMEALADAQMGEMERLKEFQIKLTQEQLKAAGGDLFLAKDASGKTLMDIFDGGSGKLAQSGFGKWSTVMGNLEDGLAKAGLKLLDAISPLLDMAILKSDDIGAWFEQVGTDIGTWITTTIPELIPKVKQAWEDVKTIFTSVTDWFGSKASMLQPFTTFLTGGGGILGFLTGGASKAQGLFGAFDGLVNTLIGALNSVATNWGTIEPAITGLVTHLPKLVAAFLGLKALSWLGTTTKALGGLFSGAGSFIGKLFGKGTPTITTPPVDAGKASGTPGKTTTNTAGAGKNTFTGPNHNTFTGPNYNSGNGQGGSGKFPGSGGPNFQLNLPQGGLPLNLPAGGLPINLPAGGFPLSYPAGGVPLSLPAGGLPVNFPMNGFPLNIPLGGLPLSFPAAGVPLNLPAGGVPLSLPAGGLPVNIPVGGFPLSLPAGGLPLNFPAGGFPLSLPAGGFPLSFPAGGVPLNLPAGGLPLNVPAGGFPLNLPAGGLPLNVPAGGFPLNLPAGGFPLTFPAAGVPLSFPATGVPLNLPSGGVPLNIPTGGLPLNLPAGGLPVNIPGGGFTPPSVITLPGKGTPIGLPGSGTPLRLPSGAVTPAAAGAAGKAVLGGLGGAGGTALVSGMGATAIALVVPALIDGFKSGKFAAAWERGKSALKDFSLKNMADTQTAMVENNLTGADLLAMLKQAQDDANKTAESAPGFFQSKIVNPIKAMLPAWMQKMFSGQAVTGTVNVNVIIRQMNGGTSPIDKIPGGNWNEWTAPTQHIHAAGIKRVPYDNYPAMLHRDETVLPANEAREFREAGNQTNGGTTINGVTVNINGANKNGRDLARELLYELRIAAANA